MDVEESYERRSLNPDRWESIEKRVEGLSSDAAILDVGCGSGAYVNALLNRGHKAFGADIREFRGWQLDKEAFFLFDGEHLPFGSRSFELVMCFEVLEHLKNPGDLLGEIRRVGRSKFLFSVPNTQRYAALEASGVTGFHYTDRTHVQFFDRESLTVLLRANGFVVHRTRLINEIFPWTWACHSLGLPSALSRVLSAGLRRCQRNHYHHTILAECTLANE